MPDTSIRPVVSVRLFFDEEKCFGPGLAELLERVKVTGSLRSATAEMEMAYSKAWTRIRVAEKALGFKLTTSTTGGRGGGGAVLTPQAQKLLTNYRELEAELKQTAKELTNKYFGEPL